MTHSLRFILLAALTLVLAGCPTLGGNNVARVSSDYTKSVKKAGLLSLLDDRIYVSYLTSSAQESFFSQAPLGGWDIDQQVLKTIGGKLERRGMTVVPIARTTALMKAYDSDFGYARTERIHAELDTLGAELGLDMVVLVARNNESDKVTDTVQNIRGYGLQKAFDTGPFAYATIYVEAYDTRQHFVVGRASGFQSAPLPPELWQQSFETSRGDITLPASIHDGVGAVLRKVLYDAIAIAAQEAGI